ncbi:MAG: autotransporter domain-containing protein [Methylophilaceae bacterium]
MTPPSGLQGAVVVSGNIVTFTPVTDFLGGPVTFTYTATAPSPGGQTSDLPASTVSFTVVAAPTGVSAASMSVPLNTATSLDLTPFISGTLLTGVNIVSAAAHGAVSVNGKVVTYTPVNDYFGTDSFTYQAYGAAGVSASAATVSVTIVGRPDPTQNANVTGLMTAQMDAAQRFNRTQLSNFQQRMEFLHRRGSVASTTASGLADSAGVALRPTTTLGTIEAQSASLRAQDNQAALATNAQPASAQPAQASPQQAVIAYQNNPGQVADTDVGVVGLLNGPVGSSLLAALTSNSVNLAALSKGLGVGGSSSDPDAVEIWVAGNLRFGSINNGVNSGYTNFRTDGVTIGADKRFSDKLVLGVGVGYAFDTAKVGTDGSKAESNGMSVAMYGSYQPTPRTFVDGLLGYGVMKFDTERFVSSVSDFARAGRRGDQVFASLASGYEFRERGFMLSPYGRVDVAYSRLREATEAGAGQNALHYDSQDAHFAQLALGLRAEATHQTNFGLALPRARLEYQNSYQEGGDTSIQYADQLGTSYRLTGASNNRSAVVAGVGSDFILKNGIRLALDYQTLRSAGYESSQAVSFRLTKELGGANNQTPYVASEELTMPKLGVRVDMGYTFDDNLNRAQISSEKRSDHIFSINLTKGINIQIRQNTRLVLNGFLGGERAYYFNGLDRVSAGGQAEFQYRTSGDFLAPTFGIFGRAATEQFNSDLRDGYRLTSGFTVRKPWTDRISTFAALSYIQKNAKDIVFDTKEISLRANIDYAMSSNSTLYMTGEYRHGDIVSTALGSLANLDGSKASVRDDVFEKQNYFSYRFGGDTILTTLGYNLSIGPTDGLDFSWRRVESTPSSVPDYVPRKKSYVDNQYSIVYLVRF